jgi:glycosyltransferase involved in cell wall biosynthesis
VNLEVIYSAAHAEFPDTEPLGGGKAVADYLIREWRQRQPFPLRILSPRTMGMLDETHPCPSEEGKAAGGSPPPEGLGVGLFRLHKPLVEMSELEYARFCRRFERATTAEILKRDPRTCGILSNDISEGPDFATLGRRGYRIATIFHVDVVEYFTKFYLHNLVRPEWLARWQWFGLMPDVLRLVFQKQYDCVRHSTRIVVPSIPMRETILRCYPWCPAEKIVVLPWGNIVTKDQSVAAVYDRRPSAPCEESALTERRYNLTNDEFVMMTLSRLSPEKGIERLLRALRLVPGKFRVLICGAAAYMKGKRYERTLRRLADERVEFLGHVSGPEKVALLRRADLFVSPSRHESYGLTIAEAQAAGCRVISHNHYGASGTVVDCADAAALSAAISMIVATGRIRKTAVASSPSHAAEQLAGILATL